MFCETSFVKRHIHDDSVEFEPEMIPFCGVDVILIPTIHTFGSQPAHQVDKLQSVALQIEMDQQALV
jgi:hypothetical protein